MVKNRNKFRKIEYQSYLFEIQKWTPSYSIGIGKGMRDEQPYWEYAHIEFETNIVSPIKYKGKKAKIIMLGDRKLEKALEDPISLNNFPIAIGRLTLHGKTNDFIGSIPMSALWGITHTLETKRIRFIDMHGEKLRYGSGSIFRVHFEHDYYEDDFD